MSFCININKFKGHQNWSQTFRVMLTSVIFIKGISFYDFQHQISQLHLIGKFQNLVWGTTLSRDYKLPHRLNVLSHMEQENNFFPVWVKLCIFERTNWLKVLSHFEQTFNQRGLSKMHNMTHTGEKLFETGKWHYIT